MLCVCFARTQWIEWNAQHNTNPATHWQDYVPTRLAHEWMRQNQSGGGVPPSDDDENGIPLAAKNAAAWGGGGGGFLIPVYLIRSRASDDDQPRSLFPKNYYQTLDISSLWCPPESDATTTNSNNNNNTSTHRTRSLVQGQRRAKKQRQNQRRFETSQERLSPWQALWSMLQHASMAFRVEELESDSFYHENRQEPVDNTADDSDDDDDDDERLREASLRRMTRTADQCALVYSAWHHHVPFAHDKKRPTTNTSRTALLVVDCGAWMKWTATNEWGHILTDGYTTGFGLQCGRVLEWARRDQHHEDDGNDDRQDSPWFEWVQRRLAECHSWNQPLFFMEEEEETENEPDDAERLVQQQRQQAIVYNNLLCSIVRNMALKLSWQIINPWMQRVRAEAQQRRRQQQQSEPQESSERDSDAMEVDDDDKENRSTSRSSQPPEPVSVNKEDEKDENSIAFHVVLTGGDVDFISQLLQPDFSSILKPHEPHASLMKQVTVSCMDSQHAPAANQTTKKRRSADYALLHAGLAHWIHHRQVQHDQEQEELRKAKTRTAADRFQSLQSELLGMRILVAPASQSETQEPSPRDKDCRWGTIWHIQQPPLQLDDEEWTIPTSQLDQWRALIKWDTTGDVTGLVFSQVVQALLDYSQRGDVHWDAIRAQWHLERANDENDNGSNNSNGSSQLGEPPEIAARKNATLDVVEKMSEFLSLFPAPDLAHLEDSEEEDDLDVSNSANQTNKTNEQQQQRMDLFMDSDDEPWTRTISSIAMRMRQGTKPAKETVQMMVLEFRINPWIHRLELRDQDHRFQELSRNSRRKPAVIHKINHIPPQLQQRQHRGKQSPMIPRHNHQYPSRIETVSLMMQ